MAIHEGLKHKVKKLTENLSSLRAPVERPSVSSSTTMKGAPKGLADIGEKLKKRREVGHGWLGFGKKKV